MVFIDGEIGGNGLCDGVFIPGEEDGFSNSEIFESPDGRFAVGFEFIGDENTAEIGMVDGNVNFCTGFFAGGVGDMFGFHQACVADKDGVAVEIPADALSGDFRIIGESGRINRCITGGQDGFSDRMSGKLFGCGSDMEDFFGSSFGGGKDFCDLERTAGESAGLVKDDGADIVECFEVIAAFDEDTVTGGRADAAEERQGDGDDKGAGTGNDKEDEAAAYPFAPCSVEKKGRQNCEESGGEDNCGSIVTGEFGDKIFGFRFAGGGIFDKIDDFGYSRFAVGFGNTNRQDTAAVDTAGQDFITGTDGVRFEFTGESLGIQRGFSIEKNAVEGDFFAGFDEDGISGLNKIGGDGHPCAVAVDGGGIGTDIHQVGDGFAGAVDSKILKKFADLIEQHDGNGFGSVAEEERADRGDAHEEVFVKEAALNEITEGVPDDIVTEEDISNQENREMDGKRCGGSVIQEKADCKQDEPKGQTDDF